VYRVTTTLDHCAEGLVESKNEVLWEHGIDCLFVFDTEDYNDYKFSYLNWRDAERDGRLYRQHMSKKIKYWRGIHEDKEY
jgi:hypothetical protein